MHIYDGERFPPPRPEARMQPNARVQEYRLSSNASELAAWLWCSPRPSHIDNAVTLDALAQLGTQARGIAVVHPTVTDAELKAMQASGVRGIRFTQFDSKTAATTVDMIEPLAKRAEPLGLARADPSARRPDRRRGGFAATAPRHHCVRSPRPPVAAGVDDPAFGVIRRMLDKGNTWMKLSGAYMFDGPPRYAKAAPIAQAYIKAAPERMVWGADWPHPTEKDKPDDAVLLDLLSDWSPDAAMRQRILVDNPATLYGF